MSEEDATGYIRPCEDAEKIRKQKQTKICGGQHFARPTAAVCLSRGKTHLNGSLVYAKTPKLCMRGNRPLHFLRIKKEAARTHILAASVTFAVVDQRLSLLLFPLV